tara:strand:+ start:255 stop:737 length:483 start_codon:yes stop_codon:yes gene_type:complete
MQLVDSSHRAAPWPKKGKNKQPESELRDDVGSANALAISSMKSKAEGSCMEAARAEYMARILERVTQTWVRPRAAGYHNPDINQLRAYTIATGLNEGLLLYAPGESEPTVHTVAEAGKRIHVMTVDVSGEPEQMLDRVGRVAVVVRNMVYQKEGTVSRAG